MAISEEARSDLYTGLSEVVGPERAETIMRAIPLHDLDEVATKADIALLRSEMAETRSELKTEMADLRSEMSGLRAEVKTEIAELRAELKTDIATEIGTLRRSFTTWMLTMMVANIGAIASISFVT